MVVSEPKWLAECRRCVSHYRYKNILMKSFYNVLSVPSVVLASYISYYGISSEIPVVQNTGITLLVLIVVSRGLKLNEWAELCSLLSKGYSSIVKEFETHIDTSDIEKLSSAELLENLKNRYLALEAQERVLPLDTIAGIDFVRIKSKSKTAKQTEGSDDTDEDEGKSIRASNVKRVKKRSNNVVENWRWFGWFRRQQRDDDENMSPVEDESENESEVETDAEIAAARIRRAKTLKKKKTFKKPSKKIITEQKEEDRFEINGNNDSDSDSDENESETDVGDVNDNGKKSRVKNT